MAGMSCRFSKIPRTGLSHCSTLATTWKIKESQTESYRCYNLRPVRCLLTLHKQARISLAPQSVVVTNLRVLPMPPVADTSKCEYAGFGTKRVYSILKPCNCPMWHMPTADDLAGNSDRTQACRLGDGCLLCEHANPETISMRSKMYVCCREQICIPSRQDELRRQFGRQPVAGSGMRYVGRIHATSRRQTWSYILEMASGPSSRLSSASPSPETASLAARRNV